MTLHHVTLDDQERDFLADAARFGNDAAKLGVGPRARALAENYPADLRARVIEKLGGDNAGG